MSKYVKDLLMGDLKTRLSGVTDALLVNVIGMNVNANVVLRKQLREKNMQLLVVKNSVVRRATEGTPLAPAFEGLEGMLAVLWGGEDVISLAKEVARFAKDKEFAPFGPRGGVMDGAQLSAEEVLQISKWPSREEQLSLLMGQILSPGAKLSSQLCSPGARLASQIKQKGEGEEEAS
ncbi:MAG: 50S ribosomal protein L10 [Thermoguttaceae bacterium]